MTGEVYIHYGADAFDPSRNTKTSGPMIYISLCMGGTVTPLWSSIPTQ